MDENHPADERTSVNVWEIVLAHPDGFVHRERLTYIEDAHERMDVWIAIGRDRGRLAASFDSPGYAALGPYAVTP